MKKFRIYVDTSVIGGCLDEGFADASNALLAMARKREVTLLISDILLSELRRAPADVRGILATIPRESAEEITISDESFRLHQRYLAERIVGSRSAVDAMHVALATVARADMIASWNFKHIVHFEKMRGFNAVNLIEGYARIEIHSPREIV